MTVQSTLSELVAIDSVSSRSNEQIISYLEARCRTAGLAVKRFPHVDERGVEKINLVAQTSVGDSVAASSLTDDCATVELALVGHTDTVPYDRGWTDALKLTQRDGKLFGRGACDTKAFIAAVLTAVESTDLASLPKPFAMAFTADEEIGCLGAKRLAAAKPFTARYAIIGEPTSLHPLRAGKGYCVAEIIVRGREAHSAYPQLGAPAIFRAARLIEQIEKIGEEVKGDRCASFDPPYTTINIGLIEGGTAKNIIAGECRFTLEWRPVPGQPGVRLLQLVEHAIIELERHDPQSCSYEIDAVRLDESFETDAEAPVVQFLEEASGKPSGTVAFGTEAPSMISLGAQSVVFGPGDIRVAHRTGEFVPIEELEQSVEILRQAIERFCGES